MASNYPIIAIVGRPNVGKSTLFNRILGVRSAIVEDEPGVTRDRNYALVQKFSIPFYLVDTGGFEAVPETEIQSEVAEQALVAAEEADLVITVFDGQTGLHPGDNEVVTALRQFDKPLVYAVNKCDGVEQSVFVADFYSLGIDEIQNFSALHGRGVPKFVEDSLRRLPNYEALRQSVISQEQREKEISQAIQESEDTPDQKVEELIAVRLEDEIEEKKAQKEVFIPENVEFAPVFVPADEGAKFSGYDKANRLRSIPSTKDIQAMLKPDEENAKEVEEEPVELPETISIAIIGRPNAGKSTLLNMLTGEKRAITSAVAGTTRDSLSFPLVRNGQKYELIDTAGLRKKARVDTKIERYSTLRALGAISACDVAVILMDGVLGPSEQDAKILGLAHEQGKGIVLVVNKWDAVTKDHRTVEEYKKTIRETFKFTPYAPILFVSALSGKRCPSIIEAAHDVASQRLRRISTSRLNRVLQYAASRGTQPTYRGKQVKLFFGAQVGVAPPRFALYFNFPKQVHFSYLRSLKNAIRSQFGFHGTDIKIITRSRSG